MSTQKRRRQKQTGNLFLPRFPSRRIPFGFRLQGFPSVLGRDDFLPVVIIAVGAYPVRELGFMTMRAYRETRQVHLHVLRSARIPFRFRCSSLWNGHFHSPPSVFGRFPATGKPDAQYAKTFALSGNLHVQLAAITVYNLKRNFVNKKVFVTTHPPRHFCPARNLRSVIGLLT
jgi:hypothetical protein